MSTDDLLGLVDRAFGGSPRPEHFTNFAHCEECAEHDELLRGRDRCTLKVEDVGNPASDPLSFSSVAGIAYYMPTLVRLALTPDDIGGLAYAGQLARHFWHGGRFNECLKEFDALQREAVIAFVGFLINERSRESGDCVEVLLQVHDYWTVGPMRQEDAGDYIG